MSDTTKRPSPFQKWEILSGLTDEEFDEIAFLVVYGEDRKAEQGLSALYVTKCDEVLGVGYNSLVGSDSIRFPMSKAIGDRKLTEKVKVDELSGLGLWKIVVGLNFGAALTRNNQLYVWGDDLDSFSKNGVILVACTSSNSNKCVCTCRNRNKYTDLQLGGLMYCGACKYIGTSTFQSPPLNLSEMKHLIKQTSIMFHCVRCGKACTFYLVGGQSVYACAQCDLFLQAPKDFYPKDTLVVTPHKVELFDSYQIIDISCGSTFLVMQTSSNSLLIWGWLNLGQFKTYVPNPSNITIKNIVCGGSHLAVVSDRGELFTCGVGVYGQLGRMWDHSMSYTILYKVPLPEKVVKVCCGRSATVCLTSGGSVYCFGGNLSTDHKLNLQVNCQTTDFISVPTKMTHDRKFTDIANSYLTNTFSARSECFDVYVWGDNNDVCHTPKLAFGAADCVEALANTPITHPLMNSLIAINRYATPVRYDTLYGNKFLSDWAFKLSDGDFPVHRYVLYTNSAHFKELLSNNVFLPDTMDVSLYNPKAYRTYLKYLYQEPIEDLNMEDLFDLYELAITYKETPIMNNAFLKIKSKMNEETVLLLHHKAKSAGMSELVKECQSFMDSPAFKNALLNAVTQKMDKSLAALLIKH